MLNRTIFFTIFILFLVTPCIGQTIQGYSFNSYPSQISSSKKATLNLKSNPNGSAYRTRIREQYRDGKIDFGGQYITTMWGAGTGMTVGVMVDILTGKIYDLPLSEENAHRGANHDGNNNILFKPNSNLFICYISTNNEIETLVDLKYSIYKWNDKDKKFILQKTKSITAKRIED